MAYPAVMEMESFGARTLLDKIDKLRALGATGVPLPQMVVVGDQSAGKSSVLESLTGFHFPRNVSLCTRYATEIICRREPLESIAISIIPHNASKEREELVQRFRREASSLDSDSFADIFREASKAMGIKSDPEDTEGSAFSEDVLRIEVSGPTAQHLTIIDVPGMFENDTPGLTTKTDVVLVKKMVERYIGESRTIILAVVPCNGDIANQKILTLAAEVDPKGERTLGVLTKPDLVVENATKQVVIDLLNGKRRDLKLGYCVVKNRGADDTDSSAEKRDLEENAFFANGPWTEVDRDRLGISALRQRIQHLLIDRTKSEFPKVQAEIMTRRKAQQQLLQELGEARSTPDEQRIYLGRMASRFPELKNKALDAQYKRERVFDERPELKLITRIRELNEAFSHTMINCGHEMEFARSKSPSETDSSYNGVDTLRTMPSESKSVSRSSVSASDRDSLYACELTYTIPYTNELHLEDVISGAHTPEEVSKVDILDFIHREHFSSRGYEIGTYNSELVRHIFKEQAKRWEAIAMAHVSNVILVVDHFVNCALEVCCPDPIMLANLQSHLYDGLVNGYDAAMDQVKFLLEVEMCGTSVTYHPDYEKLVGIAKDERMGNTEEGGKEEDRVEETCHRIHDSLRGYYEISRHRFVDVVCQQVVDYHLLRSAHCPLVVFSGDAVLGMTAEQLETIAGEDLNSRQRRERLTREVGCVTSALKVLKA